MQQKKAAGGRRGRDGARDARKAPPRPAKAGSRRRRSGPPDRDTPPKGINAKGPGARKTRPAEERPRSEAPRGERRREQAPRGERPRDASPRGERSKAAPPRGERPKTAAAPRGERPKTAAAPRGERPKTAAPPRGERPKTAVLPRGDDATRARGPAQPEPATAPRGRRPAGERRPPPPPPPKKEKAPAPLPDGPPRAGTVAIVGRPNVGKSTLLNAALDMPLAIVSPTPQTTRDALLGVVHHGTAEIGLLDTPGLFAGQTALDRVMLKAASEAAEGADVVVFVTALSKNAAQVEDALRPHHADVALLRGLPEDAKVVLVVNKIDLMRDKRKLLPLLAALGAVRPVASVVPVSALREDGVRLVLDEVAKLLPEAEHRFGPDDITDRPARFFAREYVREQILLATREEVPHAVAVSIDEWQEGQGKRATRVAATIHVERPGQKKILVGAGGAMLTRIGSQARARLAELVGGPVHLDLFVRVTEGWRERPGTLRDLGYGGDAEGEGGGSTMFVADLPAPGADDGEDSEADAGAEEER